MNFVLSLGGCHVAELLAMTAFVKFDDKQMIKQQKLQEIGLTVLRFRDNDVMKNMESVIVAIEEFMLDFEKHTANSSQEGNTL